MTGTQQPPRKGSWRDPVIQQLRLAAHDRAQGREGRARVRARLAAAQIVIEYLRRQGRLEHVHPNAYRLLEWIQHQPDLPEEAREPLQRLTMRVDTDFRLPPHIDLLHEVQRLAQALLQENLQV